LQRLQEEIERAVSDASFQIWLYRSLASGLVSAQKYLHGLKMNGEIFEMPLENSIENIRFKVARQKRTLLLHRNVALCLASCPS